MNIEDIKVGETYYVRVKVKTIGENYISVAPILQGGVLSTYWPTSFALGESSAFFPIPLENGTKNSETAPKYDPCRLYRKGDKVREISVKGRRFQGGHNNHKTGELASVTWNENSSSVMIQYEDGDKYLIDVAYIELVTPVEELEPYKCGDGIDAQLIFINDELFAEFENEEDAKRVCALLNAEYRKEQQ